MGSYRLVLCEMTFTIHTVICLSCGLNEILSRRRPNNYDDLKIQTCFTRRCELRTNVASNKDGPNAFFEDIHNDRD